MYSGRSAYVVFGAVYAAAVIAHWPLLRLPYYWDEAGYFIPAALDLSRHGLWIPRSTLANGHPPLVMAWLAVLWHLFHFTPLVTRAGMLASYALLVAGVFRLARELYGRRASWAAALLIGVAPLVFAQATLAQLDLTAAALVVWALVFRVSGSGVGYSALATAACLTKETALIVPAVLFLIDAMSALRRGNGNGVFARVLTHAIPAAALGCWLMYYRHTTGYWVGNAGYLSYNVATTLSLPRIAMSLLLRFWQLAGYNGTFVVTVLAAAAVLRLRLPWRVMRRGERELWAVVAGYLLFHAVIGGAVLARYLLPALAVYFVLLSTYLVRLPHANCMIAACAGFLIVNWFWNPPYPFPYEDNLAYASFVHLQQAGADELARLHPRGPVLTAWPATDELNDPDLGYVQRPIATRAVEDFGFAALAEARGFQYALLYSREYQPRDDVMNVFAFWPRWKSRYFHTQQQLREDELLRGLNVDPVFRRTIDGQWLDIAATR